MNKILILFSLLFGASTTFGGLSYFYHLDFPIWFAGAIAVLSALGLLVSLRKKNPDASKSIEVLKQELELQQRQMKIAMRGHLKLSVLFWIHAYRKEKAKSFEEAKREIFKDLRREYVALPWMLTMIEELRIDFSKFENL